MRVCAIDVGSNTVLSLVAERGARGELRALADCAAVTGLGRGSFEDGRLRDDAIERTWAALERFVRDARALRAGAVHGVGTSALRDARDRERFVARARRLLDTFDVVSGEEEARLSFEGAGAERTIDFEHAMLDIGGGSTELAVGLGAPRARVTARIARRDPSSRARWLGGREAHADSLGGREGLWADPPTRKEQHEAGQLIRAVSLPLGSVRLFERHLASDPPSASSIAALEADVDRALDAARLTALPKIVALAGTATTMACVVTGTAHHDVARVMDRELDVEALARAADALARTTLAERRADPRIEPARADVIVAGAIVFARVARRSGCPRVLVTNGGLRWAVARRALTGRDA